MSEKCWECERGNVPLHNHHPVPRVRGGIKTIPLCEGCHSKAHHRKKNMDTSKLTKDGLAKRKEQGAKLGGAPFGYTKKGNTRGANQEEMNTVRKIKELRAAGNTLRSICDQLSEAGRQTRKGGPWRPNVVRQIALRDYGEDLEAEDE